MSLDRLLLVFVIASSASALKKYSGIRAFNNTERRVLVHDQTVAIVEYGRDRQIFTCELIEVKTEAEKKETLEDVYNVIPRKPYRLKFAQMMDLMKRCALVPEPKVVRKPKAGRAVPQPRTFSNFAIFPGTKWCGSGDIAEDYFDIGTEANVDKCCRAHDICPVKVLGRDGNYGLKNSGLFTASHCSCDKEFFNCLKKTKNNIADSMGAVYFNLLGGSCVYKQDNKYLFWREATILTTKL